MKCLAEGAVFPVWVVTTFLVSLFCFSLHAQVNRHMVLSEKGLESPLIFVAYGKAGGRNSLFLSLGTQASARNEYYGMMHG